MVSLSAPHGARTDGHWTMKRLINFGAFWFMTFDRFLSKLLLEGSDHWWSGHFFLLNFNLQKCPPLHPRLMSTWSGRERITLSLKTREKKINRNSIYIPSNYFLGEIGLILDPKTIMPIKSPPIIQPILLNRFKVFNIKRLEYRLNILLASFIEW